MYYYMYELRRLIFGPLENGKSGNEICAQWCFLFHYIETKAKVTPNTRMHQQREERGWWVKTTQTHESSSAHQKAALSAKSLWSSLICIKNVINTHNSYKLAFTNSIRPVPFDIQARPFASNNKRQLNYCCVVGSFFSLSFCVNWQNAITTRTRMRCTTALSNNACATTITCYLQSIYSFSALQINGRMSVTFWGLNAQQQLTKEEKPSHDQKCRFVKNDCLKTLQRERKNDECEKNKRIFWQQHNSITKLYTER